MYKTKTVNLRSQDRSNNTQPINNGDVSVNNCKFVLDKPVSLRENGRVGLRSAYMPITFKNIDKTNDRFILKFLPAHTSPVDDCVYVVCQLQHGYYNSSTAIKNEVNRVLGLMNSGVTATIDDNAGGVSNQYNTETTNIVGAEMTATLGTDDNNLDHLIFNLPSGAVFTGSTLKSADTTQIGATTLDGGFQILFGDQKAGARFPVKGRTAHRVLGFGAELTRPQTLGDDADDFVAVPQTALDRAGTDAQAITASYIANQMRTPYIYIRSNLSRDCRESFKKGNPTNLLAKVPVKNSTYGSMEFYEPDDGSTLYFNIPAGDINNIDITLTDGDDKLLEFDENDWELVLCFKGDFYN